MKITITLTSDNGNISSVEYALAGTKQDGRDLFDELKSTAWAASAYVNPEGDDALSQAASYYTPA